MALALYRKYRPRTFAEVIGQEHVTEPLMQALRSGRLNHAYLFSGPRGCGKTSSARILARSLNCEKGPTPEPCGVCDSCVALAPDGSGSIDVIEIDAASHGGVDDARELRERAFFAPVSSRFKVYVIDEAHMVSSAGFNALLKLVEEPPEYVKFVFATTEPEKVLGTIKSRTHHYPFRLIPPGTLRPYLEELAAKEGVSIETPVFPLVVRAGGGSARDSLSVLDQLIAGAGPEGVTYSRAVALLGVTDAALLDEMCDAVAAGDGSGAYGAIDKVMEAGHDPRRFASDLLERFRDLIVLQQVRDAAGKGLLDYPSDQLERMAAQAGRLGLATLTRCAGIVHDGLTEMRGTTAPRLLLEILVARMLLPGADDSIGALLQRMERLERRLGAASSDAPSGGHAPSGDQGSAAVVVQQDMRRVTENLIPTASPPTDDARSGSAPPRTQPDPPAPPSHTQPRPQNHPEPQSQAQNQPRPEPAQSPQPQAQPAQAAQPQPHAQGQPYAQAQPHAQAPGQPQAQPAQTQTQASAPSRAAAPPAGAGGIDAAAVRRVWDEVLTAVRRKSVREWAVAREATVRDVQGNRLILLFQHQVHANMLSKSPGTLAGAVSEMIGGRWEVHCEIAGQSPPPTQAQPTQAQPAPVQAAPVQAPVQVPPVQVSSGHAQPGQNQPGQSQSAERAPSPRPPAGAATDNSRPPTAATNRGAAATTEEGWPVAAVPGGNSDGNSGSADAWPAAAVPGGQTGAQTGSQFGGQADGQTGGQSGGLSGQFSGQTATATATAPAPVRTPATRQALARSEPQAGQAGRQNAQPSAARAGWSDEPPPVYESDYGFDPGDEPADEDEDGPVVRETSEEQALRLLKEHLGAERID